MLSRGVRVCVHACMCMHVCVCHCNDGPCLCRPMDLSTIKKKIESGVSGPALSGLAHHPLFLYSQLIKTDIEFQRDILLMFQNAFMYNNSEHEV